MAIVLGEPEAERFEELLFQSAGDIAISAVNLLESMTVAESRFPGTGAQNVRELLEIFSIGVEPINSEITELGFRAWKEFGRGRHPAALNLGDCFAYALTKQLNARLLFKGEDFRRTDLISAIH